ncbi:Uncharacterised protein [Candidatus Gugararchaeum adminiculabundum]|nr:Uncharacterised protein [Candidatus Gugararchaeum adminiculabundum]
MTKTKIESIVPLMDALINDTTIPKNIRKAVGDAKEKILSNVPAVEKATGAIYKLDEISEDINMPMHARTQIWQLLSALESVKEEDG